MITWSHQRRYNISARISVYLFKFSMYYAFGIVTMLYLEIFECLAGIEHPFCLIVFCFRVKFRIMLWEPLQCFTIRDIFDCLAGIWYLLCLGDFYFGVKFWILWWGTRAFLVSFKSLILCFKDLTSKGVACRIFAPLCLSRYLILSFKDLASKGDACWRVPQISLWEKPSHDREGSLRLMHIPIFLVECEGFLDAC